MYLTDTCTHKIYMYIVLYMERKPPFLSFFLSLQTEFISQQYITYYLSAKSFQSLQIDTYILLL